MALRKCVKQFTPLESPGIYAGDVINRNHQLLVKVGSKPHLSNGVCSMFHVLCSYTLHSAIGNQKS